MNIYLVRYWPMSDGQAVNVKVNAETAEEAQQIVEDNFDKYCCAQVMSVALVEKEEETKA